MSLLSIDNEVLHFVVIKYSHRGQTVLLDHRKFGFRDAAACRRAYETAQAFKVTGVCVNQNRASRLQLAFNSTWLPLLLIVIAEKSLPRHGEFSFFNMRA